MSEPEQLGSDGLPVRDSGVWAGEKLYYLERYLDIVSVGMVDDDGGVSSGHF